MAVLTGRSGQLFVDGTRVARCTGWSLDEQRPMLDVTPVDSWDAEVIPGRRSATGTAKVLYDPTDTAANAFFSSILLNGVSEVPISLLLDSATGTGYPVAVHLELASHAVARGEAQMRDISFRVSDVGIELEIIGNSSASQGITQLYTGAVFGIDGAWTYLWTSSGPTIADPTAQSTNITFPTTGTFTITLTATLGLTVLTATKTVEVIETPLMWVSRATNAMQSTGALAVSCTCIDSSESFVYHVAVSYPDASVATPSITLSKLDFTGTRLETKRLDGIIGDADACQFIQVLSNGDLLLAFATGGAGRWLRITADLSTIVWQVRSVTGPGIQPTEPYDCVYDPSTERVFFQRLAFNEIGYIDVATGTATEVTITMDAPFTPTSRGKVVLLESGRVLFTAVASGKIAFIECNNDLRVGGVFAPIKSVEHTFTSLVNVAATMETDNYIAVANYVLGGGSTISLYSKTDYSHVKSVSYNGPTGDILTAYYSGGEIVISYAAAPGWRIFRVNEELTSQLSHDQIFSTASSSGPPWANNAPGLGLSSFQAIGSSNGYQAGVGVMAVGVVQRNPALTNAEMCVFYRVSYTATDILDYGTYYMTITPDGVDLPETLFSPTGTFNRTYTFANTSVNLGTSSVSISDETNLTFETYVLTA